ncbi:MAG: DNA translocase FtsK 4TM domain-containing protein [bacterium]
MAEKRARMNERQREEILGILLMTLGMFVLLSLISYDTAEDPQGMQFLKVENAMGVAGAYLSHWIIKVFFGYPGIVVPFLFMAWGWNCFHGGSRESMTRVTYYVLVGALYFATFLGLPHAMDPQTRLSGYTYSGLIGGFMAHHLHLVFGSIGSVIVLLAVGAVLLVLTMGLSLTEAAYKAVDWLSHFREHWTKWKESVPNFRDLALPGESPMRIKAAVKSASKRRDAGDNKEFEEEAAVTPGPEPASAPEPTWKRLARLREGVEPPPIGAIAAPNPGPAARPRMVTAEPNAAAAALNRVALQEVDDNGPHGPFGGTVPVRAGPKGVATGLDRYVFPPLELLHATHDEEKVQSREELLINKRTLEERLAEFDVSGEVREINPGPVITRYEFEPAPGIKVSRITALADDLALAMRAKRIRIVAPIPGKAAVGVELPNPEPQVVYLRHLLESEEFRGSSSPLTIALGKTISGKPYVTSLEKMPHMLIAGATGSGKSVCLNTIIASILFKAHPKEVQFVLVDPKRLELTSYRMLRKHHLSYRDDLNEEVVTSPQNALAVLRSLEWEMENRYNLLASVGVRNIAEYNTRLREGKIFANEGTLAGPLEIESEEARAPQPLPYIVLVIDELADLMLTAAKEVEEPIARLTQLARAVGIHLVVATQRPSVDVITGVIKANFPARMAFQVASKIDSRTILDMNGAEKLLGNGDMLFLPPGSPEPVRIHGAYVSSDDIERAIEHIRNQPFYEKELLPVREESDSNDEFGPAADGRRDELFNEALKLVVRHQQGSISLLQRRLKIGYSRAARLIDELEAAGVVGGFDGSKAREVLVDETYLEQMGLHG